jgi:hypothetical protein
VSEVLPASPPPPPSPPALLELVEIQVSEGDRLTINGRSLPVRWRFEPGNPGRLWLPLDLLEAELGVETKRIAGGSLELSWFGQEQTITSDEQISLDDEVAVEVAALLRQGGMRLQLEPGSEGDEQLALQLPAPRFVRLRESIRDGSQRLVLDLSAPTLLPRADGQLQLPLTNPSAAALALRQRGLEAGIEGKRVLLPVEGWSQFSLGQPARLVLDERSNGLFPMAKRPQPLLPAGSQGLRMEQRRLGIRRQNYLVSFVRFDPTAETFKLVPLSRQNMVGLGSLLGLARSQGAVAAINGGFFNRIQALPLGGLRDDGDWLSGPILDRGAMAWAPQELPSFSRVRLNETLVSDAGARIQLNAINSGWVSKGVAQYNSLWGPRYKAITGREEAVLVQGQQVARRFNHQQLRRGVGLRRGETLVVARGGAPLPLKTGDGVSLERAMVPQAFADLPNLIQGGPLLLNQGKVVLNGKAERFSSAFMRQKAPRSVVGSDGERIWLLAVEGQGNSGPTLRDTAELMQKLGLKQALNLDGGSSTRLMVRGQGRSSGRGFGAAIHNGLGIVLSPNR